MHIGLWWLWVLYPTQESSAKPGGDILWKIPDSFESFTGHWCCLFWSVQQFKNTNNNNNNNKQQTTTNTAMQFQIGILPLQSTHIFYNLQTFAQVNFLTRYLVNHNDKRLIAPTLRSWKQHAFRTYPEAPDDLTGYTPRNLTARPWKLMIGRRSFSFPFGIAYFFFGYVEFPVVYISWFQMNQPGQPGFLPKGCAALPAVGS